MPETPFEEQLAQYFPDLYKLNQYGKIDKKIWISVYALVKMIDEKSYGEIRVTFQDGKINHTTVSVTK